jgi:hypothetical protein
MHGQVLSAVRDTFVDWMLLNLHAEKDIDLALVPASQQPKNIKGA